MDQGARSAICTRRWGCFPCEVIPGFTMCSNSGWVNVTLTRGQACGGNPQLAVLWWGEDLNHGTGVMTVCLSYLPDQVQPQPPNPPNNHTLGVSWALYLANGNEAGDWPLTEYEVSFKTE